MARPLHVEQSQIRFKGKDKAVVFRLLLLSRFSRVRLCDPIDGSPLGSSVPGILQARILEWAAISFPNACMQSRFSCVRLCETLWTAAHQAPPLSTGFSRQEYWSGLPFPSPVRESEVAQLCPTLSDPMDCSLPSYSAHGIFQARVLEWDAIAFSALTKVAL